MARRFYIWATVAGFEAASRLGLQVVVTAVLARLLRPEDFGVSALVLTLVAIFSVCVATPFEDALAQRKVLRRSHIGAALAVSWLAALGFVLLSVVLGQALATFYKQPEMAALLPVAALLLFPNAPLVIGTALARRRRRFNAIALSSLIANTAATAVALAAGLLGAGVWALILFRVAAVLVQAVALALMIRLDIRPRWSRIHFDDLFHFAWFALWIRLTENFTYLLFNYLISIVFGLPELGRFNMALRVIEPIRGALAAIAHNLNFSHFQPVAQNPALLGQRVMDGCARLTLLAAPAFFGLAATAPLLVPVLAGPGWEESIAITQILAVGSGFMLALHPVQTGLAASGRPQYWLQASLIRIGAICLGVSFGADLGALGIGFARVAGDLSDIVMSLWFAHRRMDLPWGRMLAALMRPLALPALMGCVVAWAVPHLLLQLHPVGALAASVALGVLVYGALLLIFVPGVSRRLLREALGGRLRAAA